MEYFTNVESWTIQELLDALQTNPTKKSRIKIPSYQRSLVWRQAQKKLLIDSIKRGLPVGALLLYHEKAEENYNIYHLIDGLQRSTSVKSYVESPTKFYSEDYLEAEFVNNISSFLDNTVGPNNVPDQQAIKGMLIDWIQSLKGFSESDGFSSFHLAEEVDKSVDNSLSKQALSDLARALPRHLKKLGEESDISNVRVPVIIYSGDQSNLPEIFERMNSKGTQLSKYQIFAATWSTYPAIEIDNRKIIDQIKGKYEALVDEGLEVDNFDPSNFYTGTSPRTQLYAQVG